MHKRTFKIGIVALLALAMVLSFASLAGASPWSDLPDGVLDSYGVTSDQVAGISSGYPDGSFKPYQNINRAQFVKMATAAFTIPSATPATPTFTDVPATHYYYQHIEGAYAAGLTNGIGAGRFGPEQTVTREQAIAMIVRQVAAEEGFALASLTEAQISAALAGFADAASVSAGLRDEMAYALLNDITKGNAAGNLAPKTPVSRLTAAVLLVRAGQTEPPAGDAPVITALSPADGKVAGGTTVTITGTNLGGATAVTFGGTVATDFTVVSDTTITAVAPAAVLAAGKAHKAVNVSVTTAEGTNVDTLADDYIYYTLTLTNGSNVQTYSLSDLKARTAVSGYWGPHKDGGTNNHYTGVLLLDLLADVGGLPAGHGLTVKTADNFDCNYDAVRLAQMADGSYQMWEHNNTASMSDDVETTGSVQMVLAYEMNGGPLEESTAPGRDVGPVRIVLIRPAADVLTEGKFSPYLVVAVEVLE